MKQTSISFGKKQKKVVQELSVSKETYTLPELFVLDSKGTERFWRISCEEDKSVKVFGVVNTIKPITKERTFVGLNVGKKNETTAEEQAKRVAERMDSSVRQRIQTQN